METIKIVTLEWRKSGERDWASVNYNRQTRAGFSCWAKKSDIEKYELLAVGKEIMAEIRESGQYKNIVAIQGEDGRMYRCDRDGNVSVENEQPSPTEDVPIVEVGEKPKEEKVEKSDGSFVEQLDGLLLEVEKAKDANTLTDIELRLSTLNLRIAQHHAENNHEANELELEYKKKRHTKMMELKEMNGDMSDTKAKTMAEADLWEDKANLIVAQDKVKSDEIISGGITNLLFSIKDRLKSLNS